MERDDRIAEILGEWQDRRDRGEPVTPEEVVAAHPDLAAELKSQFAFLGAIEGASGAVPPGAPSEIGDFRIVKEIGRGGMGVVYEAEQVSMARRVALKVLSLAVAGTPHAVRRFEREARAAGRLHHTNIVPIYAMGEHAGHWYYAMELVRGMPLSRVVAQLRDIGGHPTEESLARMTPAAAPSTGTGARSYFVRVAEMFAGVAEALDLAHREGIVHRDIKPSNLLLDAEGVLKIVDFGLAQQSDAAGPSMTMTGDLLGTPAYMSPEQAMAKRIAIDHRTDVYSLGATLYELLTLRPPFRGSTLQDLCTQIVTKDPALPSRANASVPRDLETIVLKAMEKDRDRRYSSAAAFARDLRRFATGMPVDARRIGVVSRAVRWIKRNRVRLSVAASVLALVGAGVFSAMRAADEAARRRDLEYAQLCAHAGRVAAVSMSLDDRAMEENGAATIFTEAIHLAPHRPEAFLGRALAPGRPLDDRLRDLNESRIRGLSACTWHLARAYFLRRAGRGIEADHEVACAGAERGHHPLDLYFEAHQMVAKCRWAEASEALTGLLSRTGLDTTVRCLALNLRAHARRKIGEHSLALEDLIRLQTLGDESAALRASIASAWRGMDTATAVRSFDETLAQVAASGSETTWIDLCRTLRNNEDYDWMERATRQAIDAYPAAVCLLVLRSDALLLAGRREESLAESDRAIALGPEDAAAYHSRGTVLLELGRHEEALAEFDRVIGLDPRSAVVHNNRGNVLLRLGRRLEALEAYELGIDLDPQCARAHCNRGIVLLRLGRREEALAEFDRAIDLGPDDEAPHDGRATALRELGRREEALAECERAIELDPKSAGAHNGRGITLAELGRPEEALPEFNRAIELDPNDAKPHMNRGNALFALGRPQEALTEFQRAIDLDPRHVNAYIGRGYVLFHLGRHEEGLAEFERAIDLDPEYAWAYGVRADALYRLGRYEEAVTTYGQILDLEPGHVHALSMLAWVLATCPKATVRNPQRAVDLARKAAAAVPNDGGIQNTLGVALYRAEQLRESLKVLGESMRLKGGGDAYDWYFAAMAHARLGEREEARALCDRAIAWTREHAAADPDLSRLQEEAAAVLEAN